MNKPQFRLSDKEEDAMFKQAVMNATGKTCRQCEHRQRWECNSKVFQYCGKRPSKRTDNGLLKIKAKNPACHLFEPEAKCTVCGSTNIIEAPHMGKNCNDCHPINT